ncbi:serine/threonine protein phosphatase [Prauserella muralis]|uniref:Serine/threonine protein phosphatase n=1 Tax=Prauserella muralis TaxID=588067 RepID=A0A2V4B4Y3_9PSEU|nr:serine/threonine protein phosphatase [Prauserella muralis]
MAGSRWDVVPVPVVVVDDGLVRAVNPAARSVLPAAQPDGAPATVAPEWLRSAQERAAGSPDRPAEAAGGWLGQRSFVAHPVREGGSVTWFLVEDTDARRANAALEAERRRASVLAEVSSVLQASLNPQRCRETAAELAARHLADAALVIAPSPRRRLPMTVCVRGGAPRSLHVEVDPEELPGLPEALRGFPPVPSRWVDPAAVPSWAVPEAFGELGSLVVTPLPGHGVPAGALVLLRGAGHGVFSDEEDAFARIFAARAGAAMSAARLLAEQSQITDTLMRDLLPSAPRRIAGVEFAGGFRAAEDTEHIGGDFYDVHPGAGPHGDESLAVLGDVCGKGLSAAVLTGKIRNTVHALLPMADDHERMLRVLNGALNTLSPKRFATLVLASARRTAGGVRLRLTCAGHLPPLVLRLDGRVEECRSRGTLVGALPEIEAVTDTVLLAPGETCVLFTDGIVECRGGPMGGEQFGEDRLRQALAGCTGMPAEAVVERVQMLASDWVGRGLHDDMAVLVVAAPREPVT